MSEAFAAAEPQKPSTNPSANPSAINDLGFDPEALKALSLIHI